MALHVGLVGLGDAGTHHARVLAELEREGVCRWTAVCARNPQRMAEFRRTREVPEHVRSYVGLEALLDAGICDALILATPDDVHTKQLYRCASRGVHVLVEKPLALGYEPGRSALELARSCDTIVRVGYHLRFHEGHRLVYRRREELIGPLRRIDLRWAWPDPATEGWRARGQGRFWSLAALGSHCIDLARWFVGDEPRRIAYLLDPPMAIDRAAELSLAFARVMAHIGVAITHRARSRVVLVGERGEIECLGTLGAGGDGEIWVTDSSGRRALEFSVFDPYASQLRAFIRAIGSDESLDIEGALGNLAVLEAIDSGGINIR